MARSPNCGWHVAFSLLTIVSFVAIAIALLTPAWLTQNTPFDGGSECTADNPCGSLGPVYSCNNKTDSPLGGTCKRWDERAYNLSITENSNKLTNTDYLTSVAYSYPIVYWRAATALYSIAAILVGFTMLFSLWNWTLCTKTERPASGVLFFCELLILSALLLYFGGLGELDNEAVVSVCDCNLPGVKTQFAAFATNPGNCSFAWSAGVGVASLLTTLFASLAASKAKISDEYYA